MSTQPQKAREFTGKHMLLTIVGFFGVVIGVNLTMATLANTSWTGLVVENTYVASQQFNQKAKQGRAQAALGWTGKLTISDGLVGYALADATGKPVSLRAVKVLFRHPAFEAEDKVVALAAGTGQAFSAQHTPKDGVWIVEIDADAGLTEPYRDVRRIRISKGAIL
ncbi:FixH family protein [Mesorhizobium sp. ES1-4]|uniref:FixH family protein n=1 Tax=Mesorhizobium sp. ES1-4 TaxID=2876627 RepID=UPI001CCABB2D|nr:FixH family protein [Mesorhizobium sp. ES1-4]MBZ9798515.1 FixH family protein [Mesorhizobium sp. ES1-4]